MNIVFNNNTLYVDFLDFVSEKEVRSLKKRVFNILDDYDIENIVLNIISNNRNNPYLDEFIDDYYKKYSGNLFIR